MALDLLDAIIRKENCTVAEAKEYIANMVSDINDGENPEDVLEEFGLEPDYVMDLLDHC